MLSSIKSITRGALSSKSKSKCKSKCKSESKRKSESTSESITLSDSEPDNTCSQETHPNRHTTQDNAPEVGQQAFFDDELDSESDIFCDCSDTSSGAFSMQSSTVASPTLATASVEQIEASFERLLDEHTRHMRQVDEQLRAAGVQRAPVCNAQSLIETTCATMPSNSAQLVAELRNLFLEQLANDNDNHNENHNHEAAALSVNERNQLATDHWFLMRFLLRTNYDVRNACELVKVYLRTKRECFSSFISARDIPREIYALGALFVYEPDRKGNTTLYVRARLARNTRAMTNLNYGILRHFVYRAEQQSGGKGVALILDVSHATLANADFEMTRFLVHTLTQAMPRTMSYILVHNLPFFMRPFWHLIRALISHDQRHMIQFSTSNNIAEFVDEQSLPDFMGGSCTRPYNAPPDDCCTMYEAAKLYGIRKADVIEALACMAPHLPAEMLHESMRDAHSLQD